MLQKREVHFEMTFSLPSTSCLLKLPIDIYELNQVKSPSGHHYFTCENLVYHKVIKVSEKNYEAGVSTVCPSSAIELDKPFIRIFTSRA